jgi:hypothetical protein
MASEVFFVRQEQTGNFQAAEQILVIDLHGVGEVEINFRQKKVYFRKDDVYGDIRLSEEQIGIIRTYVQKSHVSRFIPAYSFEHPMTEQVFTLMLWPNSIDKCTTYVVLGDNHQLGSLTFTGKGIPYRVLR